jgi:hypothetical protein
MASPNYTLPSWLQSDPTVPAKNWLTGVQVGAAIGEAKKKLAAQQQQFAVEAQQKQDQLTASALKEAQELQVSKAYNDQQVSLKQQQLKIADEKVGAEIQKAARQFQAQQAYQKDFESGVQSGLSEDEAAKSAMFKNLSMFGSGTGMGAAMRSMAAPKDTALKLQNVGGQDFAVGSGGRFQAIKPAPSTGSNVLTRAKDETGAYVPNTYLGPGGRVIRTAAPKANPRIKELESGLLGDYLKSGVAPDPKFKALSAAYPSAKKEYDALKSAATAAPGASSAPSDAAPASSTDRIKVRSPDGQTGTIPKSQLDDAIDAGYEQVE